MIDLFGFIRFFFNLILYPFAIIFLLFYRCLQWLGLQPIIYDYQDHIILITGSANGLGKEIALAFARAGASLALLDIDDVGNRETQQQCLSILHSRNSTSRVRIYHVDLTHSTEVYACAEKIRYDLGQVSILVANAGFVSGRTLLTESDTEIERTFSINSLSPIWLIKAFLPYMLDANRGHVVFVSSFLGVHASHGPISYVSSKHANVGLSRSLRLDIHATHPNSCVSVHCICPYLMRTKMFSPVINRVSLQFVVPVVSPRYVANQVLDAIEWRRNEIILPYRLKYLGLILHYLLPERLFEWMLFQTVGRRPLDEFSKNHDEFIRERRKKHIHTAHKENIDLI